MKLVHGLMSFFFQVPNFKFSRIMRSATQMGCRKIMSLYWFIQHEAWWRPLCIFSNCLFISVLVVLRMVLPHTPRNSEWFIAGSSWITWMVWNVNLRISQMDDHLSLWIPNFSHRKAHQDILYRLFSLVFQLVLVLHQYLALFL